MRVFFLYLLVVVVASLAGAGAILGLTWALGFLNNAMAIAAMLIAVICLIVMGALIMEELESGFLWAFLGTVFALSSLGIIAFAHLSSTVAFIGDLIVLVFTGLRMLILIGKDAIDSSPQQTTSTPEEIFESWFAFHPNQLPQKRWQKEALVKLAFLANELKERADKLAHCPNLMHARPEYDKALRCYNRALQILNHFSPELTQHIPHWTELPKFLQRWLQGEPIMDSPNTETADVRIVEPLKLPAPV